MGKTNEEGNIFSKHPQFLFCAEAMLMCVAGGKKLRGLKKMVMDSSESRYYLYQCNVELSCTGSDVKIHDLDNGFAQNYL